MNNLTQQEREWCEVKPKRRKPRKRTVYVLTGSYSYESTHVLGVYSTRKRAEKARSTGSHGLATDYDFYSIDGCILK